MEAALRTAAEILEGKPLEKLEFEEVRGQKGIKKGTVKITATAKDGSKKKATVKIKVK